MPQWLVVGISGVTCGGKTTLAHALRDYFASQRNCQLGKSPYVLNDVQLISQDDYFLPIHDVRHTWAGKLNAINFELLSSLDMKQMLLDITWIIKGQCLPNYADIEKISYANDTVMLSCDDSDAQKTTHSKVTCAPSQPQTTVKSQSLNHKHPRQRVMNVQPASVMRVNSQLNAHLGDRKINVLIIEGFLIFKQPELLTMCDIKLHLHLPYEKCFERRQLRTYDPPDVVGYFEVCVWPCYENYFTEFRNRKDIHFLNGEMCKEKIFKHSLQRIVQHLDEQCDIACPPPYKFLGIPSCKNNNNNIATSCYNNFTKKS